MSHIIITLRLGDEFAEVYSMTAAKDLIARGFRFVHARGRLVGKLKRQA